MSMYKLDVWTIVLVILATIIIMICPTVLPTVVVVDEAYHRHLAGGSNTKQDPSIPF